MMASGASAFLGFSDAVGVVHTPGLSSSHYEDAFIAGTRDALTSLAGGDTPNVAAVKGRDAWKANFTATYIYFQTDPRGARHANAVHARVYAHFAAAHAV